MKKRPWVMALVAVLAVFVIYTTQSPPSSEIDAASAQYASTSSGDAQVGGRFTLVDSNGALTNDVDFRGKIMVVFLGYSHCPDICLATLDTYTKTLKALGDDANHAAFIFISVDPARDTPERLKTYLAEYDARIIGLTGDKAAIDSTVKAYKAYYGPAASGAEGLIDHTGSIYIMDREGKFLKHYDATVTPETLTQAVEAALRNQL